MIYNFSIVINTFNRAHTLSATLSALDYLRHPNYEVIVVNGPSTDGTETILAHFADKIRIGRCAEANLSKSRNIGISMARGDIVCFIDDDAVPEPNWLDQLALGYSNPDVAGVGGYIRDPSGIDFQWQVVVRDRLARGPVFASMAEANLPLIPSAERYFVLIGCNSSYRRQALLDIKGFDEEFAYGLDDCDVGLRLAEAGYRVLYVPSAEVHHKYASSHLRTEEQVPKNLYVVTRSNVYFYIKNTLSTGSLENTFRYINNAIKMQILKLKYWLSKKKLDKAGYNALINDIERGKHDGIRDALACDQRALLSEITLQAHAGDFKPYLPTLAANKRLKFVLAAKVYLPSTSIYTLATKLAALGHEVSVVTESIEDCASVDFEDNVWVHRTLFWIYPTRTSPSLTHFSCSAKIKDQAYSIYDEVKRVQVIRGLDVMLLFTGETLGLACINDSAIPTIFIANEADTEDSWQDIVANQEQYQATEIATIVARAEQIKAQKIMHHGIYK